MSSESGKELPKLDKPGAGLPFLEWFVAKYFIVPRLFATSSRETAIQKFQDESDEILRIAKTLTLPQLTERRLIKRLPGLEDSSRYWSVAMTMEHLVIVGGGTSTIIKKLSQGSSEMPAASTAAVKPSENRDPAQILENFHQMTEEFVLTAKTADLSKFPNTKFNHPWFGPLNAYQWLVFAPMHQGLHRKQIESIVELL